MALAVELTKAYRHDKSGFLAANGENSFLVSSIKRIERRLRTLGLPPNTYSVFPLLIFEDTHLSLASASVLGCLCLANLSLGAIAPCALFLAGQKALEPLAQSTFAPRVRAVKDELGW